MAASHSSIPPFPDDIDRETFGHWLSGFTDGEGCFYLCPSLSKSGNPYLVGFFIGLRDDDKPIIEQIRSFWQCGRIRSSAYAGPTRKWRPQVRFIVNHLHDLSRVVIPHFETYPLRAKKAQDFIVWRQGVELMCKIKKRRRCGRYRGTFAKWTSKDRTEFMEITATLKETRAYKSSRVEPPQPPPKDTQEQQGSFW